MSYSLVTPCKLWRAAIGVNVTESSKKRTEGSVKLIIFNICSIIYQPIQKLDDVLCDIVFLDMQENFLFCI